MAGESVDVGDQLRLLAGSGRAAHALAERDPDAGRPALERPEDQLATDIAVEAGPVDVRQALPQQRRDIGHVGDRIGLAGGQRVRGLDQLAIERSLVRRFDLEIVHLCPSSFRRNEWVPLAPVRGRGTHSWNLFALAERGEGTSEIPAYAGMTGSL